MHQESRTLPSTMESFFPSIERTHLVSDGDFVFGLTDTRTGRLKPINIYVLLGTHDSIGLTWWLRVYNFA
jgi:hypothetical protein